MKHKPEVLMKSLNLIIVALEKQQLATMSELMTTITPVTSHVATKRDIVMTLHRFGYFTEFTDRDMTLQGDKVFALSPALWGRSSRPEPTVAESMDSVGKNLRGNLVGHEAIHTHLNNMIESVIFGSGILSFEAPDTEDVSAFSTKITDAVMQSWFNTSTLAEHKAAEKAEKPDAPV